jgi:hypothetical protein
VGEQIGLLLATLTELELDERHQRRIQRHLLEARLPTGKTLDSFDFTAVPMLSCANVAALATGVGWIDCGGTILLFGPSGTGKVASQRRLRPCAHRERLPGVVHPNHPISCSACNRRVRLCRWRALSRSSPSTMCSSSEDLCYVRKHQAETSVLFELIAARYERRSLIVTANHPFERRDECLSGCRNDARGCRSTGAPLDDLRNERRKLSAQSCCGPRAA